MLFRLSSVLFLLLFAMPAFGQTASAIRYVFGPNSYTDSTGELWSPVPVSELPASSTWHWSTQATTAAFTGTPDPGLYKQQIAENAGDNMTLTVPVAAGTYTVNLYFAEPYYVAAGDRIFGVVVNGTTIVSRLDLFATAGLGKPVIESAQVTGSQVALDLTPIISSPIIAAIEIIPASTTTSFNITATVKWDDGTAVTGSIAIAQVISTSPTSTKSLGTFALNSSGVAAATVTPNLSLPLTFSITLLSTSGQVVNTMTLSCDLKTLQTFPQTVSPSIVLAKADSALKSFSF